MKELISGASFHDFKTQSVLFGVLGPAVIREKDGEGADQKKGSVMGYLITKKDGSKTLAGASHQITKAVEMTKEGAILRIEFLGKSENAKGQPVNTYKIDELDDQAEWDSLEPDTKSLAEKMDE